MKYVRSLFIFTFLSTTISLQSYQCMFAPWRGDYLANTKEQIANQEDQEKCVFCQQLAAHDDEKNLFVYRSEHVAVMLNRFPYNKGHLLIMPLAHHARLDQLTTQVQHELMDIMTASGTIVTQALNAQGVNIGMNIGRAAGASLPGHLHIHVLPRWMPDTGGFFGVISDTQIVSVALPKVYALLKPYFDELL